MEYSASGVSSAEKARYITLDYPSNSSSYMAEGASTVHWRINHEEALCLQLSPSWSFHTGLLKDLSTYLSGIEKVTFSNKFMKINNYHFLFLKKSLTMNFNLQLYVNAAKHFIIDCNLHLTTKTAHLKVCTVFTVLVFYAWTKTPIKSQTGACISS